MVAQREWLDQRFSSTMRTTGTLTHLRAPGVNGHCPFSFCARPRPVVLAVSAASSTRAASSRCGAASPRAPEQQKVTGYETLEVQHLRATHMVAYQGLHRLCVGPEWLPEASGNHSHSHTRL